MDKRSEFWVEIVCDECSTSGPGQFVRGGQIPVRDMAKEAERLDWRRKTGGTFECPACKRATLKRVQAMVTPFNGGR